MRKLVTVLALSIILTGVAQAKMFQWTHPSSGNVQLSGSPPAWYRAEQPGPRVLVFENGQLVDDTAVEVPESQRIALRAAAFGDDLDPQLEAGADPATADSSELKAAFERAQLDGVDIDAAAEEFKRERAEQAALAADSDSAPDEQSIDDKVTALKALIDVWDQQQLEQARSLLELLPENGGGY